MTILRQAVVAAFLGSAVVSAPVRAGFGDPAWEFSTENVISTNGAWNFGTRFHAEGFFGWLGYYDDFGDGFADGQTHDVALYDLQGRLIRSATISNSNMLVGHWRWARVPQFHLSGAYQIHGTSGTDNYTWNTNGFMTFGHVLYLGNTWAPGNAPVFLDFTQDDTANGYWGANLARVPEPLTWVMLIVGFGLVGAAMRQRRDRPVAG